MDNVIGSGRLCPISKSFQLRLESPILPPRCCLELLREAAEKNRCLDSIHTNKHTHSRQRLRLKRAKPGTLFG